jgi:hypothetical protein
VATRSRKMSNLGCGQAVYSWVGYISRVEESADAEFDFWLIYPSNRLNLTKIGQFIIFGLLPNIGDIQ